MNVKEELLTTLQAQRARLENLLQNPESGFRVLARAQAPESAVPSKRKYYAAAGIPIACVLLVIVLVLVREFRRLNLHTAAEVAFWCNGAVCGSTIAMKKMGIEKTSEPRNWRRHIRASRAKLESGPTPSVSVLASKPAARTCFASSDGVTTPGS